MNYYKAFKEDKTGSAQDYIYAAGYIDVEAIKNKINCPLLVLGN